MSTELKLFTITRSKWDRGNLVGRLLRGYNGKQCCLGQFCSRVLGIEDEQLLDKLELTDIHELLPAEIREWAVRKVDEDRAMATDAAGALMHANDRQFFRETEREALITEVFAELGYSVRFED